MRVEFKELALGNPYREGPMKVRVTVGLSEDDVQQALVEYILRARPDLAGWSPGRFKRHTSENPVVTVLEGLHGCGDKVKP